MSTEEERERQEQERREQEERERQESEEREKLKVGIPAAISYQTLTLPFIPPLHLSQGSRGSSFSRGDCQTEHLPQW